MTLRKAISLLTAVVLATCSVSSATAAGGDIAIDPTADNQAIDIFLQRAQNMGSEWV
jgi:hypothetical protein